MKLRKSLKCPFFTCIQRFQRSVFKSIGIEIRIARVVDGRHRSGWGVGLICRVPTIAFYVAISKDDAYAHGVIGFLRVTVVQGVGSGMAQFDRDRTAVNEVGIFMFLIQRDCMGITGSSTKPVEEGQRREKIQNA